MKNHIYDDANKEITSGKQVARTDGNELVKKSSTADLRKRKLKCARTEVFKLHGSADQRGSAKGC